MPKLTEHSPTEHSRMYVREMTAIGFTTDVIADKLKITIPTLQSMYKEDMKHADADIMRKIANNLISIACNPKGGQPTVTAGIYLTKVLSRKNKAEKIMTLEWDDGFRTGKVEEKTSAPTTNYNVLPDNGRGPRLIEQKKK